LMFRAADWKDVLAKARRPRRHFSISGPSRPSVAELLYLAARSNIAQNMSGQKDYSTDS
jgi:hypothetical protein